MKKISESKKSELIKKEEFLKSEFNKLEKSKVDLAKSIKEFDNVMDLQIANLRKEKSAFDISSNATRHEQVKEQGRLDARSRLQNKEKESMLLLKSEYINGVESNKAEDKRLQDIARQLSDQNNSSNL